MSVKTYDPEDITMIVNGVILTGFADGTFVAVEQDEEDYTPHVGAKGEVSRAVNANKMGKITTTLKHVSPSNTYLNELSKGRDMFPVSVVNQNLGTTEGGNDCWIEKRANSEYGKEISEREWVFIVPVLEET